MTCHRDIDALWAAFRSTLPTECQQDAHELPVTLRLAPLAGVPWSEVFKHEVTLGVPAMLAPALPQVSPSMVRSALLAHMLAVIEAFCTDRIEDGQVESSPELSRLVGLIRAARDRAIEGLGFFEPSPYLLAESRTMASITTERALLTEGVGLSFYEYLVVSLGKQNAYFPASLALARAAGYGARQQAALLRMLQGLVLGLQFQDDVVDWEDDWHQGGAWAVGLSRSVQLDESSPDRATEPDTPQRLVFRSGVLERMLWLAYRRYREARRLATALGAHRIAAWARQQEVQAADLARNEAEHAGYAVRAHKLAHWAAEVLA